MKSVRSFPAVLSFMLFFAQQAPAQWTAMNTGINNGMTTIASLGRHVFGAYNQVLCHSIDDGDSWRQDTLASVINTILPLVPAPGDTVVFIGTNGGLFRSNDFGMSWTLADTSLSSRTVSALSTMKDPNGTQWVVAAADSHGVYRSSDTGQHWSESNSGLSNVKTRSLCVLDSLMFLAGTGGGVFFSTDVGASWSIADSTLTGCLLGQGAILMLGTSDGFYRSSDQGTTWVRSNSGLADTTINCLAASRKSDGNWIVLAGTDAGVYRSSDGGLTWGAANGNVTQYLADRRILGLGIHDTTLFAGTFLLGHYSGYSRYGTFRSLDEGASWTEPCTRALGGTLTVVGRDLYCSEGERILRLNKQGGGWHSVWETSYPTMCGAPIFGPDSGTGGLRMMVPVGNANTDTLVRFFCSTDGEATWTEILPPRLPSSDQHSLERAQFLGEKDSILFFHVHPAINFEAANDSVGGLFCSSDRGNTWVRSSSAVLNEHLVNYDIADLVAFPDPTAAGGKSIFVGTWNGAFRSTDDGVTWSQDTVGITMRGLHRPVLCGDNLYMLAGGTVLTTYDDYGNIHHTFTGTAVYRWDQASRTWAQLGMNVPVQIGRTFSVSRGDANPGVPSMIVYGPDTVTGHNVACASDDAGVHWGYLPARSYTIPEGAVLVDDTVYESYSNPLDGPGVQKACLADVSITSVSDQHTRSAVGYLLAQNYPNPFNPTTTIQYTVAGTRGQGLGVSEVRIVIYDVLGRNVAVLVDERKAPGTYTVKFDASRLASGVYFCRMQAGSFVETKNILVMK